MSRKQMIAVAGGVLVVAVAAVVALVVGRSTDQEVAIVPAVTPEPTATATPAPPPEPRFPQPKRFRVVVTRTHAEPSGNAPLFGRTPKRNIARANKAAETAAKALQRYLNATFVDPRTRFSPRGVRGLFSDEARRGFTSRARRSLGVGLPPFAGATTGDTRASAIVLLSGNKVHSVTLKYTARMRVISRDRDRKRWLQSGELLMEPRSSGWRVTMFDVKLVRR